MVKRTAKVEVQMLEVHVWIVLVFLDDLRSLERPLPVGALEKGVVVDHLQRYLERDPPRLEAVGISAVQVVLARLRKYVKATRLTQVHHS